MNLGSNRNPGTHGIMTRREQLNTDRKFSYFLLITKVVAMLDSPMIQGPKGLDELGIVWIGQKSRYSTL